MVRFANKHIEEDMLRRKGVTQREIANIAEVSQATVSRVLANDDRVDQETAERVRSVIRQFDYRPHVAARSLRNHESHLIGLVIKRPEGGIKDDPFFANLASEIMDYLSDSPYHLCMDIVTEDTQGRVYDDLLRTRRVDGLILVESEARDERIQKLQKDRFPFVLIGNPSGIVNIDPKDLPFSVDNDNEEASQYVTHHLIEAGYRKIGIVAGPQGVTVSEDRISGYCDAVAGKQQEPLVWHCDFGIESARRLAEEILRSPTRPDALVVLDDLMAMGVVQAARKLGIRIPEELGVISFNDSSLCSLVECGLSSVSLNIEALVRTACQTLMKIIDEEIDENAPRRSIVPAHLQIRGSSTGGGTYTVR